MAAEPKKQQRMRTVEKFHPVELEKVPSDQVKTYLVGQSRRANYVVFSDVFKTVVLDALISGNYRLAENIQPRLKGDCTSHDLKCSIFVRMDVSFGPGQKNVIQAEVDILGVKQDKRDKVRVCFRDPELHQWCKKIYEVYWKQRAVPCISAVCPGFFENARGMSRATCYKCGEEQCVRCQCAWSAHGMLSCAERKMQAERTPLDRDIVALLLSGTLQPCPTCAVLTHKTDGCNHMTCPTGVRHHWCWACGQDTSDGPYEHYTTIDGDSGCPANVPMMHDQTYDEVVKASIIARNRSIFGDRLD